MSLPVTDPLPSAVTVGDVVSWPDQESGGQVSQDAWTGLAVAIKAVRVELQEAVEEGPGLRFRPGKVELEFTVDVHTDAQGRSKVVLLPWLRADGGAGRSHEVGHRLKVTLLPVNGDGSDNVLIGKQSGGALSAG
jgi:hypothetical protein